MYQTPPADLIVDEALIRHLLRDQHPDLAGLPLQLLDAGWDNYMFRLGEDLLLRLPRRQIAVCLLENEQKWLPGFQARLEIPISAPLRIGRPVPEFPWPWSVLPFIPGVAAVREAPDSTQASRLGVFLKALHQQAPPEAPPNPYRGVSLRERAPGIAERMNWLAGKTDLINDRLKAIWQSALDAPVHQQKVWLHGDLHARNVIVHKGKISGIIDWGDLTAGDAATDLAAAWALFDKQEDRKQLWAAYNNADARIWQRAKGWAILFGCALLSAGLTDHPEHTQMGRDTLRRVLQ